MQGSFKREASCCNIMQGGSEHDLIVTKDTVQTDLEQRENKRTGVEQGLRVAMSNRAPVQTTVLSRAESSKTVPSEADFSSVMQNKASPNVAVLCTVIPRLATLTKVISGTLSISKQALCKTASRTYITKNGNQEIIKPPTTFYTKYKIPLLKFYIFF